MKSVIKVISIVLILLMTTAFAGCGTNEQQSSYLEYSSEFDVSSIQKINYSEDEPMAGAWKLENYPNFVFMFDGSGNAYLILDNVGFIGIYTYDNSGSSPLFKTQLVFGLDGSYTYTFSEDNNIATLVETTTMQEVEMTRVDESELSYVIQQKNNVTIDENILGAWKAEDNTTVYFDINGIMYMNEYGVKFTYSNYSADGSVIESTYKMSTDVTDTYEYSVMGDTLTLDGFEYERIDTSELK